MQHIAYYQSPIGLIKLTGQDGYITSLQISEKTAQQNNNVPDYLQNAIEQLDGYFKGTLTQFDLPMRNVETPAFTQLVWNALIEIPYGKKYSYGDVAKKVGNAKAARAVGNACNRNPLPLIVPCHRIVGSNGAMTGFALGIDTKEWLLAHEQRILQANG